jgi:hypothetical protein
MYYASILIVQQKTGNRACGSRCFIPCFPSLILPHILQIDVVKGLGKPTSIAEVGRPSALSSLSPSAYPKMWGRIRLGKQGPERPFPLIAML